HHQQDQHDVGGPSAARRNHDLHPGTPPGTAENQGAEMKRSKAYKQAADLVDREHLYSPLEAAELAKKTSATKMDATVEVAMRLGVDPRKADQMVRGTVNLPHG